MNEGEEILKFGQIIRVGSSSIIVDVNTEPFSPVIEHIIAIYHVLSCTQLSLTVWNHWISD